MSKIEHADIIKKETVNSSLIGYLGLVIGVVSTLFIYPLNLETYGSIQFVISTSQIFYPILSFGLTSSVIYFYHDFEQQGLTHELLKLVVLIITGMLMVSGGLYFFYFPKFVAFLQLFNLDVVSFQRYQFEIFVITIATIFTGLAISLLSIHKKIALPQFISTVILKFTIGLLVLLNFITVINDTETIQILMVVYIFSATILVLYVRREERLKLNFSAFSTYTKIKLKEISNYSFHNFLATLGSSLVYRVDIIMITFLLGVKYAGIYSIFLFLGNVIEIPSRSFIRIASPILSRDIKQENYDSVNALYKSSSLYFTILGGGVALTVFSGLESVLSFMKNGDTLISFMNVWIILVLAKLIDMSTSLNSQILIFSKYYRVNLLFLILLGGVNCLLNYYLIQIYGLKGAAMATGLSLTLYNLMKLIFIKIKFDVLPFSAPMLQTVLIIILMAIVLYFLPHVGNRWIDLILRVILTTSLLFWALFQFNLSEEIQKMIVAKWNVATAFIKK